MGLSHNTFLKHISRRVPVTLPPPDFKTNDMKTLELSTGTLLVVDKDEMILKADGYLYIGHPSEITGEVWEKVVEMYPACSDCYKDYGRHVFGDDVCQSPLQSGRSLCAAHNIKETDVLLFKPNPA